MYKIWNAKKGGNFYTYHDLLPRQKSNTGGKKIRFANVSGSLIFDGLMIFDNFSPSEYMKYPSALDLLQPTSYQSLFFLNLARASTGFIEFLEDFLAVDLSPFHLLPSCNHIEYKGNCQ